jgi:hypothetical protein
MSLKIGQIHTRKKPEISGIQPIEALKLGLRLGLEPEVKVRFCMQLITDCLFILHNT